MVSEREYDFSFTASSLRLKEMLLVANREVAWSSEDIVENLGSGKRATGKTLLREILKRLSKLSKKQTDLFIETDLISQKQIAFLSVCKTHTFIRDFTVEVLREKLLVFEYEISEGDYISFLRRKMDEHPKIEKLSESTLKKIKQVCFKILEQAGLIDNVRRKQIQPQIIDTRVVDIIAADNAEWLKIFLMSDLDIIHLTK